MDQFVELLRQVNIAQIFIIFAGGWIFYNRLKNDLGTKIDKLNEKVEDIDRRLCRIEGSLATQGHCLFNQQKQEKKAE